jgi:hypothetical protein
VELVPFDEVNRRLALSRRSYLGLREIPIERIVGSIDRSADFRRDFRPRRRLSRSRLASLRAAFPDGVMPAISVFEVGGAYFVEDGHHRVALAREQGADFIDAEVTRLETTYEVGPDVDVAQLIHTEQQRNLLNESGLGRARPDAVIEFTFADGYAQLAEIIKAHGYDLARHAADCPLPSRSRPTGTTPSSCPDATPHAEPASPRSTFPGSPPRQISSSGSTSCAATSGWATPPSTSTPPQRTRGKAHTTNAPAASSAAETGTRSRAATTDIQANNATDGRPG